MSSGSKPTSTPHRFLPASRKSLSSTKDGSRRASALRTGLEQPPESLQDTPLPSQFASAPHFTHGGSITAHPSVASTLPPKSTFVEALKASSRLYVNVEDDAAAAEDDEMLDNGQTQGWPLRATGDVDGESNEQWTNDLAFSPKRRKLNDAEDAATPEGLNFEQFDTVAPRSSFRAPRQIAPASSSIGADGSMPQRPVFVRPITQPQEPVERVGEIFSPHKRGQKFVSGGMAATVQQWVLETGQAAAQSRRRQGYLQREDYVMRVKIEGDVEGDGPFTARIRLPSEEIGHVLLTGGSDANRRELCSGCVVGIRSPTWEVEMDVEVWTVAVDWRVLS